MEAQASTGTDYPATLVTTADTDDRVVPGHSFKFAAALQRAQGCDNPALIRIEVRAGHAAGKPIWVHEFMYGLMQGYDAVQMQTDVQVGGTEQLFNLMAGRKLQTAYGQRPQVVLAMPILVGGMSAATYRGVLDEIGAHLIGRGDNLTEIFSTL